MYIALFAADKAAADSSVFNPTNTHHNWKDKEYQISYLNWLGKKKGLFKKEDWLELNSKDFHDNYGSSLLSKYQENVSLVFEELLDDVDILDFKKERVPNGYWNSKDNQKFYLKWLEIELGFTKPTDWYLVKKDDFFNNYGATLYRKVNLPELLKSLYPNHDWQDWMFKKSKAIVLRKDADIIRYLKWLGKRLNYTTLDDWYRLSKKDLLNNFGDYLYRKYSRERLLKFIFPNEIIYPWKFTNTPHNFWENKKNRIWYINWLKRTLNIKKKEDWYKINGKILLKNHGKSFFQFYENTKFKIFDDLMPELDLHPWLFSGHVNNYWIKKENQLKYLRWFKKKFKIESYEDWYKISYYDFVDNAGAGLLVTHYDGKIYNILKAHYPEFNWDESKIGLIKKTNQRKVYEHIKKIFPNNDVFWDYKFKKERFPSGRPMEIDVYIPSLNLAFEYQGEGHFHPIDHWGGEENLKSIQQRDKFKKDALSKHKIVLIEIPYTWDGTEEYLKNILLKSRHLSNECPRHILNALLK